MSSYYTPDSSSSYYYPSSSYVPGSSSSCFYPSSSYVPGSSSSYYYPSSSYVNPGSSSYNPPGSSSFVYVSSSYVNPQSSSGQSSSGTSSSSSSSSGNQNIIAIDITAPLLDNYKLIEAGKNYNVTLLTAGDCWNDNSTVIFNVSNAQLYYADQYGNKDQPIAVGMIYPLRHVKLLYLVASSPSSSMDDVVVSVTGYPNCYSSSSGYDSSSGTHPGHSNTPCSDSDTATAWDFKVTGPDTKVVGQHITMSSAFLAPAVLQNLVAQMNPADLYQWTISGSQPIAGYNPTAASATVTQISAEDKKNPSISYYCTGLAGTNVAQCHFKLIQGAVETTKDKKVAIQRPTVIIDPDVSKNKTKSEWTNLIPMVGRRWDNEEEEYWLSLGHSQNGPGITWSAEVKGVEDTNGTIAFVQLINTHGVAYAAVGNEWAIWTSGGAFYLDEEYPAYNRTVPVPQNTKATITADDSPGIAVLDLYKKATKTDSMQLYLISKLLQTSISSLKTRYPSHVESIKTC